MRDVPRGRARSREPAAGCAVSGTEHAVPDCERCGCHESEASDGAHADCEPEFGGVLFLVVRRAWMLGCGIGFLGLKQGVSGAFSYYRLYLGFNCARMMIYRC